MMLLKLVADQLGNLCVNSFVVKLDKLGGGRDELKKATFVIANVIRNFETQFPFEGSAGIAVLKENGRHLLSAFLVARMLDITIQSSIANNIVVGGDEIVHVGQIRIGQIATFHRNA